MKHGISVSRVFIFLGPLWSIKLQWLTACRNKPITTTITVALNWRLKTISNYSLLHNWQIRRQTITWKNKFRLMVNISMVTICMWGKNVLAQCALCYWTLISLVSHLLGWMTEDPVGSKSILVNVIAWCCQARSHWLNKCWPGGHYPVP